MVRKICLLLIICTLILSACGSSSERSPEPQTEQAMLQATIAALQATVDASDTAGVLRQPTMVEAYLTESTQQPTPIQQPTPLPAKSLAEQLVGDWRWSDGNSYEMFVLAADGRFYDPGGEDFGTYAMNPQESLLVLQYPYYTETYKIVDISADRLRVAYSSGAEIEMIRYGAGPITADDLAGLWYFEPNGLSEIEWRIFFDSQGNFLAWADGVAAWTGSYEHFTDDVLLLPGAPWEDSINGPPTLHIEELKGDTGYFSFPEVEVETGYDATRVREDEKLAKQLEGGWLLLDGDEQYEVELGTTFMSVVMGTLSGTEYTFRTFEDGTIGWFAKGDYGEVFLCSTAFTDTDALTLTCPAGHPEAFELQLQRAR